MKTTSKFLFLLLVASAFLFTGCDDDNPNTVLIKPEAPINVYTITGDREVNIYWNHSFKNDVDYYRVYVSTDNDEFNFIGSTSGLSFLDNADEVINGIKYYYAVTAVGFNGAESELSMENAFSTPRPQGFNAAINDFILFPATGAFSFLTFQPVHFFEGNEADFFYEFDPNTGKHYINVWLDTDIADMGSTDNINDIPVAPNSGWSNQIVTIDNTLEAKYVEAFVGRTYVIHTHDNFYGKIRISELRDERVIFDWAFMDSQGNMELEKRDYSIREIPGVLSGEKIKTKRN